MQSSSPPSCGARGHRPTFAARDRRSAQKLRSAKWCQSKFYDSHLCDIAPRVLEKCSVHALSALVENTKVLMGCENWCEPPRLVHAELAKIWEFVAIFPRHAVGPVQQSDAAAPTARIALETSSCASARSPSKPRVDRSYCWLSGQDGLLTPTASADEAA